MLNLPDPDEGRKLKALFSRWSLSEAAPVVVRMLSLCAADLISHAPAAKRKAWGDRFYRLTVLQEDITYLAGPDTKVPHLADAAWAELALLLRETGDAVVRRRRGRRPVRTDGADGWDAIAPVFPLIWRDPKRRKGFVMWYARAIHGRLLEEDEIQQVLFDARGRPRRWASALRELVALLEHIEVGSVARRVRRAARRVRT